MFPTTSGKAATAAPTTTRSREGKEQPVSPAIILTGSGIPGTFRAVLPAEEVLMREYGKGKGAATAVPDWKGADRRRAKEVTPAPVVPREGTIRSTGMNPPFQENVPSSLLRKGVVR